MPSRSVRSLPVAFAVTVLVAVGFADTAWALPTSTTTTVRHTTPTTMPPPARRIVLLPPTTAVLPVPDSASSAGVPVVVATQATPGLPAGPHVETLPHTL